MRPVSDLTINISKLSEGTHQYDLETAPKNLELDDRFVEKIFVHAELEKTGHQVHLKVGLRTKGRFICDRCLDEFEQSLSTHYEIVYITEDGTTRGNDSGDLQFITPDTTLLDLGEDVRQFLILAVPQKLLCKEECLGLCPVCGSNRNKASCKCKTKDSDPRWEVLKKMSLN